MKAFVSSNCATGAYFEHCKALLPDWDVRYAVHPQVKEWVDGEHQPFLEFLANADLVVLGPNAFKHVSTLMKPDARVVEVPNFVFFGHRPDCISFGHTTSPLGHGTIQSKIAMAAFAAGLSEDQAEALFCDRHFEKLGYYRGYEGHVAGLLEQFESKNIDISGCFEKWVADGDFMYTHNHPMISVFSDIAEVALSDVDLPGRANAETMREARKSLDDYLANVIIWPVYPEVAHALGLKQHRPKWRTVLDKKTGAQEFGLSEMISRSYRIFEAAEGIAEKITGQKLVLSDNPKADIIAILRDDYGLVD